MELTELHKENVNREFLSQEGGLNSLLSLVLNNLMKSEREAFLDSESTRKTKGTVTV